MNTAEPHWSSVQGGFGQVKSRIARNETAQTNSATIRLSAMLPVAAKAAVEACRNWPADALCLDAYDTDAGAGEFYRKCGFTEVGRAVYRNTPLIYFERLL